MRVLLTGVLAILFVAALGGFARAQVVYETPDLSGDAPDPEVAGRHRIQELQIGVPLWFDIPRDIVGPGVDVAGRVGFDWGYFGAFIDGGVMFIPVDLGAYGLGGGPLARLHLGVGARLQLPTEHIRPYADLILDFNAFSVRSLSMGCASSVPQGFWCTGTGAFEFTPGWTGRVGVQIVARQPWAIDVGVAFSMTYRGILFPRAEWWMEPFIGFSVRP